MKNIDLHISARYIIDDKGQKKEVILDIKTFEQILKQLEDIHLAKQAQQALQDDDFIDFDEANKDILKK